MNIKKIIREEVNDFDWIQDVPKYDPMNPKVGYVYVWRGYERQFGDEDPPTTNEIIVKHITPTKVGEYMGEIEFDTVDSYWGPHHLDAVGIDTFTEKIEDGIIEFLYDSNEESINESDDFDWIKDVHNTKYGTGDEIKPIDGIYYYITPDGDKQSPINGYIKAEVLGVTEDGFYEVRLWSSYGVANNDNNTTPYYLSIDEVDNR